MEEFAADVLVAVKEAQRAVAAVGDALGESGLSEGELRTLVVETHRLEAMAGAVAARAMAACDAAVGWAADDAGSAASWLAWKARLPVPAARQRVAVSRSLRRLPAASAAWERGDIGQGQVGLLAAACRAAPEAFSGDEAMLVDSACRRRYEGFRRHVAYWRQVHDADGVEADAVDRYRRRRLHLSQHFEGMGRLDADLDPVSHAVVDGELRRLEQQLFEADWADARARRGDAASMADLARTPAQRRVDALVQMAKRSAAMPPGAKQARVLVTALVDYPTLEGRVCELADGTVLTPGELLPLLSDCDVERVVFDGPSRVLDVGVRKRLFVGATRRAVEVRDRYCTAEPCDVPADRCDVDHHPAPYHEGGPTVQGNGRLRCPRHHPGRRRRRRPPPPLDDDP